MENGAGYGSGDEPGKPRRSNANSIGPADPKTRAYRLLIRAYSSRPGRFSSVAIAVATSSSPASSRATAWTTGLSPVARASRPGAAKTPLDRRMDAAKRRLRRRAAADGEPQPVVPARRPGAGQHQVAHAGQPRHRLRPAAERHRQPGDFRQAARDQRRPRILAQPGADRHPGRDGDHVLRRPAHPARRSGPRCRRAGSLVCRGAPSAAAAAPRPCWPARTPRATRRQSRGRSSAR